MADEKTSSNTRGLFKQPRSPFWWISYSLNGQRVRESTKTESKKLALQILSERRAQIAKGEFLGTREPGNMTISQLLYDKYLPWSQSAKALKTHRRDTSLAANLCEELGNRRAADVTLEDLEIYRQKRRDAGAKPASCNREVGMLRHAFNKAIQWGLLKDNPAARVKSFKEKSRIRFLGRDEQSKLLQACRQSEQPLLFPLVSLALLTGLRAGELYNLEWRDIDIARGSLAVRGGKGDKDRTVPLNRQAIAVLESMDRKADRVFSIASVKRSFGTALRRAGIKGFRFHDLRRTFATNLASAGVDLTTIKRILGHSQFSATLMYLSTSAEHLRSAVDRLPDIAPQDDARNADGEVPVYAHSC
ncbi:MAG: site-specific integrase [Candidatus Coatesbacteria bacterium]|nr:site-specific integrase [Candidatus Coatesbacteria bacterium]